MYWKRVNPVTAALLNKMNYQEKDRTQVKLEFLLMLERMELDPARMKLDNYDDEALIILIVGR